MCFTLRVSPPANELGAFLFILRDEPVVCEVDLESTQPEDPRQHPLDRQTGRFHTPLSQVVVGGLEHTDDGVCRGLAQRRFAFFATSRAADWAFF